ncbi:hypothetical protein RRG08_042321 [Elysia crispata]|uniref:Uncharacterized protein n=1 Tax=Elysia crispata TaxID=231223 RepID=A0AAE1DHU5_9GAST|nr:hypothetical protein RRG08_042321 [Elysia crispata]
MGVWWGTKSLLATPEVLLEGKLPPFTLSSSISRWWVCGGAPNLSQPPLRSSWKVSFLHSRYPLPSSGGECVIGHQISPSHH